MASEFRVVPFARQAGCSTFDSGNAVLDRYLTETASQHVRKGIAAVMVAEEAEAGRIVGYYTLSGYLLQRSSLPPDLARRLPESLPAMLLGKLAVDRAFQGRGMGGALLAHALKRAASLSEEIGAVGIVVDAIDDRAAEYYARYGFVRLTDEPRRLFLSMSVARAIP